MHEKYARLVLSRHDYHCKAGYLECLCMVLCADYQGLNPNALVSSGLAPVYSPEGANPVFYRYQFLSL